MPVIDTLLWKWRHDGEDGDMFSGVLATLWRLLDVPMLSARLNCSNDTLDVYVYFQLARPHEVSKTELRAFATEIAASVNIPIGTVVLDRLERICDVPGASNGALSPVHYVVETDPAHGWRDELFRWYDEEHMPGLAATPGCVGARRFLNHDGGPESLACYDLVDAGVIASAPWLAVRDTQWSSRVRPQFRNTKRTMFNLVLAREQ